MEWRKAGTDGGDAHLGLGLPISPQHLRQILGRASGEPRHHLSMHSLTALQLHGWFPPPAAWRQKDTPPACVCVCVTWRGRDGPPGEQSAVRAVAHFRLAPHSPIDTEGQPDGFALWRDDALAAAARNATRATTEQHLAGDFAANKRAGVTLNRPRVLPSTPTSFPPLSRRRDTPSGSYNAASTWLWQLFLSIVVADLRCQRLTMR